MDVVAEGIETSFETSTMQALGCDYMQGDHFARPMPATQVDHFIRSFNNGRISPESNQNTPGMASDADPVDPGLDINVLISTR